mmetsp:Transcript_48844/g.145988  ORF Transcript_48844/g.145988 Transcript_48844/m.145988 type:complete len:396 (+) Transcript_48844:42-1229(+)
MRALQGRHPPGRLLRLELRVFSKHRCAVRRRRSAPPPALPSCSAQCSGSHRQESPGGDEGGPRVLGAGAASPEGEPLHGGRRLRGRRLWRRGAGRWGRGWLRRRSLAPVRAEEAQPVLSVGAAHQAHAVVVGKGVDSWAQLVHRPHVLRLADGPGVAHLGRHGREGAAVGHDAGVLALAPPRHGIVPFVVNQLQARPVATRRLAGVRANGHHADSGAVTEVFLHGAPVKCHAGTVDLGDRRLPLAGACSAGDLELEGQGPSVDQAHVHGVATAHLAGHGGVAGLARAAPGCLELSVHGRGAAGVVAAPHDAALRWPATATELAVIALLITAHLRPVPSSPKTIRLRLGEGVGAHGRNLHVLCARPDPHVSQVGNPDGLPRAGVDDGEAVERSGLH